MDVVEQGAFGKVSVRDEPEQSVGSLSSSGGHDSQRCGSSTEYRKGGGGDLS